MLINFSLFAIGWVPITSVTVMVLARATLACPCGFSRFPAFWPAGRLSRAHRRAMMCQPRQGIETSGQGTQVNCPEQEAPLVAYI